jgi:hypothetical protein
LSYGAAFSYIPFAEEMKASLWRHLSECLCKPSYRR